MRDVRVDVPLIRQQPVDEPLERLRRRIDHDVQILRRSRFAIPGARDRTGQHVGDVGIVEAPDNVCDELLERHLGRSPRVSDRDVRAACPSAATRRMSSLIVAARRTRCSGPIAIHAATWRWRASTEVSSGIERCWRTAMPALYQAARQATPMAPAALKSVHFMAAN